jgi:hypothetical protein
MKPSKLLKLRENHAEKRALAARTKIALAMVDHMTPCAFPKTCARCSPIRDVR